MTMKVGRLDPSVLEFEWFGVGVLIDLLCGSDSWVSFVKYLSDVIEC